MMTDLEYVEATQRESDWAMRGGIMLVVAFLCPLIVGPKWIFFPEMLGGQGGAAARVIVLAPLVAGLIALAAVFKMEGLRRPMTLLLAAGFCNIVVLGVVDAHILALTRMSDRLPPELMNMTTPRVGGSILWGQLAVTLGFVGLAYTSLRPTAKSGPLIAGVAGIGLLVLLVWPVNGVAIKYIFNGQLWDAAWGVPASLLMVLLFSLANIALFLKLGEPDELAALGLLVGLVMLAAPAVALFFMTLSMGGGGLTLMAISLVVKVYGTFVALHILFASGLLGWLVHGVQPE